MTTVPTKQILARVLDSLEYVLNLKNMKTAKNVDMNLVFLVVLLSRTLREIL